MEGMIGRCRSDMIQPVTFDLDDHHYALPLTAVERVIRAIEITPLPKAPLIVRGIVNVEGRIVPVVSVRKRFRLPNREIEPRDRESPTGGTSSVDL